MSSVSYTNKPAHGNVYVRPDRHQTWLRVAFALAEQGTCVRRGVGTVILDEYNQVMSSGWNGVASGCQHCIDRPCGGAQASSGASLGTCEAIHSEENALQQCKDVWQARTLYVTASPCMDRCLRKIINSGIMTIVFAYGYHDPEGKAKRQWEESKPGRQWIQVDVPECTWVELNMRPYNLPDGLYYTDDPEMGMVQVNGSQVYKGNAVQEFTHKVMAQKVKGPTHERRHFDPNAYGGLDKAIQQEQWLPTEKENIEVNVTEPSKARSAALAGLVAEIQAEADSRPRVFNRIDGGWHLSQAAFPTGINQQTGMREPSGVPPKYREDVQDQLRVIQANVNNAALWTNSDAITILVNPNDPLGSIERMAMAAFPQADSVRVDVKVEPMPEVGYGGAKLSEATVYAEPQTGESAFDIHIQPVIPVDHIRLQATVTDGQVKFETVSTEPVVVTELRFPGSDNTIKIVPITAEGLEQLNEGLEPGPDHVTPNLIQVDPLDYVTAGVGLKTFGPGRVVEPVAQTLFSHSIKPTDANDDHLITLPLKFDYSQFDLPTTDQQVSLGYQGSAALGAFEVSYTEPVKPGPTVSEFMKKWGDLVHGDRGPQDDGPQPQRRVWFIELGDRESDVTDECVERLKSLFLKESEVKVNQLHPIITGAFKDMPNVSHVTMEDRMVHGVIHRLWHVEGSGVTDAQKELLIERLTSAQAEADRKNGWNPSTGELSKAPMPTPNVDVLPDAQFAEGYTAPASEEPAPVEEALALWYPPATAMTIINLGDSQWDRPWPTVVYNDPALPNHVKFVVQTVAGGKVDSIDMKGPTLSAWAAFTQEDKLNVLRRSAQMVDASEGTKLRDAKLAAEKRDAVLTQAVAAMDEHPAATNG